MEVRTLHGPNLLHPCAVDERDAHIGNPGGVTRKLLGHLYGKTQTHQPQSRHIKSHQTAPSECALLKNHSLLSWWSLSSRCYKGGRDLGFCLRQASEGLPHVDRQQPGHAGYRVHGRRDTGRRAAAPGTQSLRSTERYLIDRVIHSLVCCSTRVVRRRDALLPKVRSFSSPITVLSQDNLWGGEWKPGSTKGPAITYSKTDSRTVC